MILLGALLIPVTFVVYVFERVSITADAVPALVRCFVVGGLVGLGAAALIEYETLRNLGTLPMLAVALIERASSSRSPSSSS